MLDDDWQNSTQVEIGKAALILALSTVSLHSANVQSHERRFSQCTQPCAVAVCLAVDQGGLCTPRGNLSRGTASREHSSRWAAVVSANSEVSASSRGIKHCAGTYFGSTTRTIGPETGSAPSNPRQLWRHACRKGRTFYLGDST